MLNIPISDFLNWALKFLCVLRLLGSSLIQRVQKEMAVFDIFSKSLPRGYMHISIHSLERQSGRHIFIACSAYNWVR